MLAVSVLGELNAVDIAFPHFIPYEDTIDYCFGPTMLPLEI